MTVDTQAPFRQGCYSQDGDIVVLCAYLGQLAHVRDALAKEVAVVIDDRDQVALAEQESEKEDAAEAESAVERVQVSKRVCRSCPKVYSNFAQRFHPRFVFGP